MKKLVFADFLFFDLISLTKIKNSVLQSARVSKSGQQTQFANPICFQLICLSHI